MNGKRAFKLLKEIGYERMGGTEKEKEACERLALEIEKIGGSCKIEEFPINKGEIKVAKLEILAPVYKEYFVTGYANSGSTGDMGITGEFYYVQGESNVDIENAKGKIVLVNSLNKNLYKKLADAGILGFVTFNGDLKDKYNDVDIAYNELRDVYREIKVIQGVNMKVQDAVDLVLSEPTEVRLTLIQEEGTVASRNLIAEIEGSEKKDEVIVFTAHYDSVRYSTGVYDNGAGSVINMEAYRYFMEHKPRYTLRFIWCGSEEKGLLGSKAYVKALPEEELKKIKFNINCDVAGPVLGRDVIFVTANNEVLHYCMSVASEIGFPGTFNLDIYSSDEIPFADKGIAAVSITRFGAMGTAYIHNRHDVIKYLDYKNLEKTGNYLIELARRIDSSKYLPFDNKVSEEIKEKVDKYLFKK